MTAVLILPARDEEACIARVVAEARQHFPGEIIVVDNGSRDHTAEVASAAGAVVVVEPQAGYGRACMAGVSARAGADVLVFMDADGSDIPSTIPALLAAIADGASLALAVRTGAEVQPGSIAPAARFGNWLCGLLIAVAWRRRIRDLSPLKAIRADALRRIAPREQTYGWTVELLAKGAAMREPITEIETGYRHRFGGQSKVSGTLTGSIKAGYRILLVLGRVMVSRISPARFGFIAGAIAGLGMLATYTAWLFSQAPSSEAVLVSSLLLAWPTLLAGVGAGVGVSLLASRLVGRRPG